MGDPGLPPALLLSPPGTLGGAKVWEGPPDLGTWENVGHLGPAHGASLVGGQRWAPPALNAHTGVRRGRAAGFTYTGGRGGSGRSARRTHTLPSRPHTSSTLGRATGQSQGAHGAHPAASQTAGYLANSASRVPSVPLPSVIHNHGPQHPSPAAAALLAFRLVEGAHPLTSPRVALHGLPASEGIALGHVEAGPQQGGS